MLNEKNRPNGATAAVVYDKLQDRSAERAQDRPSSHFSCSQAHRPDKKFPLLAGKVTGRALEHGVPHESPGEDHLKLVVRPGPRGEVLKEHHHFLKIQFLQLVRPLRWVGEAEKGFKVSETSNSGKRDRQIAKRKKKHILKGRLTVNKKLADMYTRKSGR